jgi:hypothetical protein
MQRRMRRLNATMTKRTALVDATVHARRASAHDRHFREASRLLGPDAGIESDPYGLPNSQGGQPSDERARYLDWANGARKWYRGWKTWQSRGQRFSEREIWRLHCRGLSTHEIGAAVGIDFSAVAKRVKRITVDIRRADSKRLARPRSLWALVAAADALFLVSLLREIHA